MRRLTGSYYRKMIGSRSTLFGAWKVESILWRCFDHVTHPKFLQQLHEHNIQKTNRQNNTPTNPPKETGSNPQLTDVLRFSVILC
jgi:hypothetical protein